MTKEKRATISAVLIVKNEQKVLGRCLDSLDGVDEIIVLDTGSTDQTVDVGRGFAQARVIVGARFEPFHFANARNEAESYATGDWILSIDADEVLLPGSLEAIRKAIKHNRSPLSNAFRVTFMMKGEGGAKSFPMKKAKVYQRGSWKWRYRVHENIYPLKAGVVSDVLDATMEHQPVDDKGKRHGQNLELLEICVEESPGYVVAARQLALEYYLQKRWDEALPHMKRYVQEGEGSDLEKSEAHMYVGRIHAEAGRMKPALKAFTKAVEACRRREPFYHAAHYLLVANRPEEAAEWITSLLSVPIQDKPESHLSLDFLWKIGWAEQGLVFCRVRAEQWKEAVRVLKAYQADPLRKDLTFSFEEDATKVSTVEQLLAFCEADGVLPEPPSEPPSKAGSETVSEAASETDSEPAPKAV